MGWSGSEVAITIVYLPLPVVRQVVVDQARLFDFHTIGFAEIVPIRR